MALLGLALADAPARAASRCPFLMAAQLNVQMNMNNQPQQHFNQQQFNNPMTQNRVNFPNLGGGGGGGGMNGPRANSFGGQRITMNTARVTTTMTRTTNIFDVRRTSVMFRTPTLVQSTIRTPPRITTTLFREPGFGIGGGHRVSFGGVRITMPTTRTHWGLEWNTHVFHVPSLRIHTLTRTSTMTATIGTPRITMPTHRTGFPELGVRRPEFPQLATQRQPSQPLKPVVQGGNNPPAKQPSKPTLTASLTLNMTCGKCHGCTHGGGPAKSTTGAGTLTGRTTTVNMPRLPPATQIAGNNPGKPATPGTLTGRTTQPGTLTGRTTQPGTPVLQPGPSTPKTPGLPTTLVQGKTPFNPTGGPGMPPLLPPALRPNLSSLVALPPALPGFITQAPPPPLPFTFGSVGFGFNFNPTQSFSLGFTTPFGGLNDRTVISSGSSFTSNNIIPTVPQIPVPGTSLPTLSVGMDSLGLPVVEAPALPDLVDADIQAPRVLEVLAREKPRQHLHHHLKLHKIEVQPEALVEAPPLPGVGLLVKVNLEDIAGPVIAVNVQPLIDKLQQPPALPPMGNAFADR
jgi:hypothetical protein